MRASTQSGKGDPAFAEEGVGEVARGRKTSAHVLHASLKVPTWRFENEKGFLDGGRATRFLTSGGAQKKNRERLAGRGAPSERGRSSDGGGGTHLDRRDKWEPKSCSREGGGRAPRGLSVGQERIDRQGRGGNV